jgi:hypothetical protein
MKKVIAFLIAIFFTLAVYSQQTEEIKVSALPKATTAWLAQNFKESTPNRAAKVLENKAVLGYVASISDKGRKTILVFDKSGQYLGRAKKVSEIGGILKPAKPQAQPPKK